MPSIGYGLYFHWMDGLQLTSALSVLTIRPHTGKLEHRRLYKYARF